MMGTLNCVYETPCGWCSKFDKECDKSAKNKPTHNGREKANFVKDAINQAKEYDSLINSFTNQKTEYIE